jgi:hypothetical protein
VTEGAKAILLLTFPGFRAYRSGDEYLQKESEYSAMRSASETYGLTPDNSSLMDDICGRRRGTVASPQDAWMLKDVGMDEKRPALTILVNNPEWSRALLN